MATFIIEHLAEIFFGLLSAGALAGCKYLLNQNKKLKQMTQVEANRLQRKIILDEIEPIIQELTVIHEEIKTNKHETEKKFEQLEIDSEKTHLKMYSDLKTVQDGNDKNFTLILNSYKFRLIQLCKTHLNDGFISGRDFEQLTEMYKLYTGLGGNGQAKEYYDKVMDLEIKG